MKMPASLDTSKSGAGFRPAASSELEMRTIDSRKLKAALLRLCSGKLFPVSESALPGGPAVGGLGHRTAFAR